MAKRTKKATATLAASSAAPSVRTNASDITIPAPKKKHRALTWIGGCCVFIVLVGSLLGNVFLAAVAIHGVGENLFSGDEYQKTLIEGTGDAEDQIALIHLAGVITSSTDSGSLFSDGGNTQDVLNQLDMVQQSSNIKAVILEVDSPGGSVTASEDLFQKISDVQETGIPVVTYVHAQSASGAYYATCATDYIFANPTSLNGSIGVILQAYNYGELLNKYGVRVETYKSGKFKDMLSGTRTTTAEEKEIIQSFIDSSYNIFVDHIVTGRKLEKAEVVKVADGRVLTAQQAKDAKLIDAVGFQEDAIAKAASLADIADYDVIQFEQQGGLFQKLGRSPLGATTSFISNLLQGRTESAELYFL